MVVSLLFRDMKRSTYSVATATHSRWSSRESAQSYSHCTILAREEGSTDDDDDAVDVDVAGDEAVVVLELLLRERDEADAEQGDKPCLGER